jgi:CRP-like cAMP-binding protein
MGRTTTGSGTRHSGRPAHQAVRTLAVYLDRWCSSCVAAREVAERVQRSHPEIVVEIVDLDAVSSGGIPDGVFATPTFVLNGRVVSLGTPGWDDLMALLGVGRGGDKPGMTSRSRRFVGDTATPCLMETELFQDLGAAEMEEIERTTTMTTCKRGTVFFAPDETGEVLFILKSGRVNLYRMTDEGRKLVTATLDAGSVFGEMSLAGQGMNGSFAEAAEDSTLCLMSRGDVQRVIERFPSVALRLLEGMARRLDDAETRLADVTYKSVPARIATALLRLSGSANSEVNVSHQDIADIVGTYRETTTRILNEMRVDGLVDLRRMQIEILDRRRLAALAAEAGRGS